MLICLQQIEFVLRDINVTWLLNQSLMADKTHIVSNMVPPGKFYLVFVLGTAFNLGSALSVSVICNCFGDTSVVST